MKKREIVRKSQDFTRILETKKRIHNKFYSIYYNDNSLNITRFGLSVGKKVGNAVTRNKIKRQLKNIIDKNKNLFKNNTDYIIIVRREILDCDFKEKEKQLLNLLRTLE